MDNQALIHRYLLGTISQAEVEQLDQQLKIDQKLRAEFLLATATDSGLRDVALELAAEPAASLARPTSSRNEKYLWAALLGVAASVLVMFALGSNYFSSSEVATLISSEDAAWESTLPTATGSKLLPGMLHLKAGVATVQFHSGAEVVLEAPSQLELIDANRGRLLLGAAVINVPESAIGFVLETPEGYAVDYGTQFAVRVDASRKHADFELIEGEIALHHPSSGKEVRLTDQSASATLSERELLVIDLESVEDSADRAPNFIRIDTGGRSGSILRNEKREQFFKRDVLTVKRTNNGIRSQHSFFDFDFSAVDLRQVDSVQLRLNLVPSTKGFAARLPQINRFGIYGLTNAEKRNWQIGCSWEDSPRAEDGELLGTFAIPRSQQRGSCGIAGEQLLDFLKANPAGVVTFILVRETTQIAGRGAGLTHTFASESHPEAVGPILEFTLRTTSSKTAPTTESW